MVSEVKGMKKRLNADPCVNWTQTITKFLKEQLNKRAEFYTTATSAMALHRPPPEVDLANKQWEYVVRLSEWMLHEHLLDGHEFYMWLIKIVDEVRA